MGHLTYAIDTIERYEHAYIQKSKKHRLPRKEKKRLLKFLRNEFPIMFNLMRDFHGGRILALCLKEKINQHNKMKYGNKTK